VEAGLNPSLLTPLSPQIVAAARFKDQRRAPASCARYLGRQQRSGPGRRSACGQAGPPNARAVLAAAARTQQGAAPGALCGSGRLAAALRLQAAALGHVRELRAPLMRASHHSQMRHVGPPADGRVLRVGLAAAWCGSQATA